MVYMEGGKEKRDVESHLRKSERERACVSVSVCVCVLERESFSNAILAFIELWITIIGSKCHLLKITIRRAKRAHQKVRNENKKREGDIFFSREGKETNRKWGTILMLKIAVLLYRSQSFFLRQPIFFLVFADKHDNFIIIALFTMLQNDQA